MEAKQNKEDIIEIESKMDSDQDTSRPINKILEWKKSDRNLTYKSDNQDLSYQEEVVNPEERSTLKKVENLIIHDNEEDEQNKKEYTEEEDDEGNDNLNNSKYRKLESKVINTFPESKKKVLEKKDLYNREKSKLACLIRKKYTLLMKESIRLKGAKERYVCCASCRKLSTKVIYQLSGTVVQSIISIFSVMIYVISTYYPDYSKVDSVEEPDKTVIVTLKWSEIGISIVIVLDYIFNLFTTKQKWKYVCNFLNILDIVIVFSTFLNFIIDNVRSLSFIRVFRIIRIMRVFRFYKILQSRKKDTLEENKNEISRRLISAILTVLAVVFLSTGVVHFLNDTFPDYFRIIIPSLDTVECSSSGASFNITQMDAVREGISMNLKCPDGDQLVKKRGKLTFDLAFYYMVITMATVGYGDIYPDTSWMRLVIGIFVIISIITISKQTSELNDIIKLNSEYQIAYKPAKGDKHCVLSGFFSKTSLIKFLNEFYHIDHKESSENTKIIIIQSDYPDKEIQSILLNPKFEENLHYIIGDIFSENTLQMAQVQSASSIFLISDQGHIDATKNDQFLILACKAVSQYSQSPLYVQFNYSQSLLHDWADWDMACSSQQIKMSIIIKNGFISGFSTMMMNLSSSSSSFYNSEVKETPWMLEYIHGASQEIYITKIPPEYSGERRFKYFSEKSYMDYGAIIIGVKRKIYYQEDKDIFYYIFLLNPIDYELVAEDEIILISTDLEAAKLVFSKDKKFKIEIHNEYEDDDEAEHQKLFDDDFNSFKKLIKDENEGVKIGKISDSQEEDGIIKNEIRIKKKQTMNNVTSKKIEIPEVFHKRQHFKIWETNNKEFEIQLKDHYLIFCKEDHLWEFMNCFDHFYSEVVFFVSDQHPTTKWDIIRRYFKNLVYVESSYSDVEELKKLNLEKAKHVFILTHAVENSNVNDSGILPLVKLIECNFPKCRYTLELSDDLNVRYLNITGEQKDFTANENRRDKENKTKKANRLPVKLWPKYAKSDIFFSSSLESLLAFSYHNEGLLDVLTKILGIGYGIKDKNVEENDFLSVYRYTGSNKILYEKIVHNFFKLSPPIIPIAIYRINLNDSELKMECPYIITNPKKDLELNKLDKIICIGRHFDESTFEKFISDYQDENSSNMNSDQSKSSSDDEVRNFDSKKTMLNEDLDRLDEDQLIERLRKEIKNLKSLSKNGQYDVKMSINSSNTINFNKQNTNQIIEEKNEEFEDVNPTYNDLEKSNYDYTNLTDKIKHSHSNTKRFEENLAFGGDVIDIEDEEESSSGQNKSNNITINKKKSKILNNNQIINNKNYNIKINTNNQFNQPNVINITKPSTFNKLSISVVEGFDITKGEDNN